MPVAELIFGLVLLAADVAATAVILVQDRRRITRRDQRIARRIGASVNRRM
jgi:hypothetical protein